MKKAIPSILLLALAISCFQACKKDQNNTVVAAANETLIESAKSYFQQNQEHLKQSPSGNYRIDAAKIVDWQSARVSKLFNVPAVIIPIHFSKNLYVSTNFAGAKLFRLNEISHLAIYKDIKNYYHADVVTTFPDSTALKTNSKTFTGIIFVENWLGQRTHQYKYNSDGTILSYNNQYKIQNQGSRTIAPTTQIQPNMIITTCYQIDGYNYAEGDPDGGYAWTESGGCTSMYIPESYDAGGGGDGGGGSSGSDYGSIGSPSAHSKQIVTITTGPNIIGSIQDYFKCFTNVGGTDHTYTVTICVDQPVPGTREPWAFRDSPGASSAANNPFDVGHTFLIFSETNGGNTITRNVGFYPRTGVNPWYPSDQGQLNNNQSSTYNISLTITINNAQFFNMLNYFSQGNNPGYIYNLSTNNCTTFAISALQAGFVNLSSQYGSWFMGSGYDPGDLGEDIRNMPLSSNMTRNTVENSHPNAGNCY